jgi:colicin import membrane protein
MKFAPASQFKRWLNAIYLIAVYALFTPATAQNALKNEDTTVPLLMQENAQRMRIFSERAALLRGYETQREACYQKLAVTICHTQARDRHNDQMRDLKRQETALNDAGRKRKAADRLKAVEERNSPQAQQQKAESRGLAIQQNQQKALARQEEQREREEKAGKPSAALRSSGSPSTGPVGKLRADPTPKLPPAQRPGQAERSAQSQLDAAEREKKLAERRAKQAQRVAERKKPAASGLALPN